MKMKKKAIVLLSGGLDSVLATKLLLDQGIDVVGLYFFTPFNTPQTDFNAQISRAAQAAKNFNIEFISHYLFDGYINMLRNPKYGFGKNINPCLDCHILMTKEAKKLMDKMDASFIATGEVLGQRPMSQRRDTLHIIERDSSLKGLLLRPLSAKLLPETIPEKKGIVDRDRLLDINGRSRKRQLELAEKWGIKEFSSPAGGCLLTDKNFTRRIRDLLRFKSSITKNDIELLKLGRHFRLSSNLKVIVGRNDRENREISKLALPGEILYQVPKGFSCPLVLVQGENNGSLAPLVAGILLRYCKKSANKPNEIICQVIGKNEKNHILPILVSEEEIVKMQL
jgi:tRNA-specific 2-thiouridylase